MAKKNRHESEVQDEVETTEAVEGTEVEGTEAVEGEAAEGAAKGRAVLLQDPTTGASVARKDVIKENYEAGMSRSDIRKLLEEKYGHKVAYQIVFAGTKGLKAPAKAAKDAE